ncbi:uncharacterized protein LOC144987470 [Oryzias latipes]
MDELELLMDGNRYVRDCCVLVISESWLHTQIPDTAIQLTSRAVQRSDRNKVGSAQLLPLNLSSPAAYLRSSWTSIHHQSVAPDGSLSHEWSPVLVHSGSLSQSPSLVTLRASAASPHLLLRSPDFSTSDATESLLHVVDAPEPAAFIATSLLNPFDIYACASLCLLLGFSI